MRLFLKFLVGASFLFFFVSVVHAALPPCQVAQGCTGWSILQSGTVLLGNGTTKIATTTRGNITGSGGTSVTGGTNASLGTGVIIASFSYPFPSNATSTSIAFNGGLTGILTGSVV